MSSAETAAGAGTGGLRTEPVPEEVACALWRRTVEDALATELAPGSDTARAQEGAARTWSETLRPACLRSGVVAAPAAPRSARRASRASRSAEAAALAAAAAAAAREREVAAAQTRLAAVRAQLAECQRLAALCRAQVPPALTEQLARTAAARCDTALAVPPLPAPDAGQGAETGTAVADTAAAREEAALLELAQTRVAETLQALGTLSDEMDDVQQRAERVVAFAARMS